MDEVVTSKMFNPLLSPIFSTSTNALPLVSQQGALALPSHWMTHVSPVWLVMLVVSHPPEYRILDPSAPVKGDFVLVKPSNGNPKAAWLYGQVTGINDLGIEAKSDESTRDYKVGDFVVLSK